MASNSAGHFPLAEQGASIGPLYDIAFAGTVSPFEARPGLGASLLPASRWPLNRENLCHVDGCVQLIGLV